MKGNRCPSNRYHYIIRLYNAIRAQPAGARGFDLIVGAGVQVGAPSVAELLGIPYRYVVYCPALVKSPQVTPMLFPARSLPRWCIPLAWRLVQWGYNLSPRKQVNARRAALGMADRKAGTGVRRGAVACSL
jgi:hypothetical protein